MTSPKYFPCLSISAFPLCSQYFPPVSLYEIKFHYVFIYRTSCVLMIFMDGCITCSVQVKRQCKHKGTKMISKRTKAFLGVTGCRGDIQPLHGPCRECAVLRGSQRWNAGLGASFLCGGMQVWLGGREVPACCSLCYSSGE